MWIKGVKGGGQNKKPALPLINLLQSIATRKVGALKQEYQRTRA